MKFSTKQQKDLETIKFFIPMCMKKIDITEEDIENFFQYSDRGLNKDLKDKRRMDGFNALIQGKRWRGIYIHEMYEQGVLDGSVPYFVLLEDMPRVVVDFLKKEMFGGMSAGNIEEAYLELNQSL